MDNLVADVRNEQYELRKALVTVLYYNGIPKMK